MTPTDKLLQKIEAVEAEIGVLGLGYVGLPQALEFARAGFRVTGFDVNAARVARANRAESYIHGVSNGELAPLVEAGRFSATDDFEHLGRMDVLCVCVPTPLNKTRDPDISHILEVTSRIAQGLRPGQLVVLESTTYPGTTREILLPAFEGRGLRVGLDFCLAFSPERLDPGNTEYVLRNTPKVLAGITDTCRQVAKALYETVVDRVVELSSPEAAEMVKLLENTFRSVNIALVNEVAMYCSLLGVDVWEVIEAAGTKPFGFMKFSPGPGLGGHCIPIDPHYLSWKLKTVNYRARFIELASEVNTQMPLYVVEKVVEGLNRTARSINGSKILVLGVAYKADVDDTRESPALDIINLLRKRGAEVSYHDPYVPHLNTESFNQWSVDLSDEALRAIDCAVITTDHAGVPYQRVVELAPLVVDTRNATRAVNGDRSRIITL